MASHDQSFRAGEATGRAEVYKNSLFISLFLALFIFNELLIINGTCGFQEKGDRATETVKEKGREAKDRTNQTAQQAKEKTGEAAESTKEKASEGKEKTKGVFQQTGEKVKQVAQSAADTVKTTLGLGQHRDDEHTTTPKESGR